MKQEAAWLLPSLLSPSQHGCITCQRVPSHPLTASESSWIRRAAEGPEAGGQTGVAHMKTSSDPGGADSPRTPARRERGGGLR